MFADSEVLLKIHFSSTRDLISRFNCACAWPSCDINIHFTDIAVTIQKNCFFYINLYAYIRECAYNAVIFEPHLVTHYRNLAILFSRTVMFYLKYVPQIPATSFRGLIVLVA